MRVLRASTHRAPRVAICLRQLSRRRPGSKNLLQFPVATLAGVLRCSLLPASRGVPLLVGRISSGSAGSLNWTAINAACISGLGLWAAFMLADEILKQYDVEHSRALFYCPTRHLCLVLCIAFIDSACTQVAGHELTVSIGSRHGVAVSDDKAEAVRSFSRRLSEDV